MKKVGFSLFLSITIIVLSMTAFADNGSTIVHVTRTGEKYHSADCGYLKSDIPITLQEAVDSGYTPCSRCSPPRLNATNKKNTQDTQYTSNETLPVVAESKPTISNTDNYNSKPNDPDYGLFIGFGGFIFGMYHLLKRTSSERKITELNYRYRLRFPHCSNPTTGHKIYSAEDYLDALIEQDKIAKKQNSNK